MLVVSGRVVPTAPKLTVMKAVVRTKAIMFLVLLTHAAAHLKVRVVKANFVPL